MSHAHPADFAHEDERHHPPQLRTQDGQKDQREEQEGEEKSPAGAHIVYKAILKEGEEELERSSSALFWSGLAAGLSMGFSMIGEGLLTAYLPDKFWRPLVSKFGYSAGFLIVVLGRQQLFTENTLTPVLPFLQRTSAGKLGNVLRLWLIVLAANLFGALIIAVVAARTNAFEPIVREAFASIGSKALAVGFGTVLL